MKNILKQKWEDFCDFLGDWFWIPLLLFVGWAFISAILEDGIHKPFIEAGSLIYGLAINTLIVAIIAVLYTLFTMHKKKKTDKEKEILNTVTIDVVVSKNKQNELSSTVPQNVVEAIYDNQMKMSFNRVHEAAYTINRAVFNKILKEYGFNEKAVAAMLHLVQLNSGYMRPEFIERHFSMDYAKSSEVLHELVRHNQAAYAPNERKLFFLLPKQ